MTQTWTKQRVRDEIQGLYKREGRINSMFAQTKHRPLYQAGCKYFGSWKKAVTAASFRYSDVKVKERTIFWTEERVKEEILKVYETDGKINSNHVQVHHPALYQRGLGRFGSWKAAVEAAGLDYDVVRVKKPFRKWSKKAVLVEIKRRRDAGLALNTMAVLQEDWGLYVAAQRYFGNSGWRIALTLCGVDPDDINPKRIWKKDKVLKEIWRLASLGVPLYAFYLMRNGLNSLVAAGCNCFGSWKNAIEAAGLDYEKIRACRHYYWTKEKVISEIKRLEELGIRLSIKAMQRIRADLVGAAIKWFGSWDQAVEAAGINYMEHCRVWSTKAWLRKLSKADVDRMEKRADTLSEFQQTKKRRPS